MQTNFLTKSKFTLALDCPTKLYYASKPGYKSTLDDNEFLEALAKGGIQVGELAKMYYPGGIDIETLDKKEALQQTEALLEKEEVIIYEAAMLFEYSFVRVDILVKKGDIIQLIEVKSRSWEPKERFFTQKGGIYAAWQKYLFDVAFQYWVAQSSHPEYEFEPNLMLIDKSSRSATDGLHQKFRIVEENGRTRIKVKENLSLQELDKKLLRTIPVNYEVHQIINGHGREAKSEAEAKGFEIWVETLSESLQKNEKYPPIIGEKCKNCEFRIDLDPLKDEVKSGFVECWSEVLGRPDEDFRKPHVFDIWNEPGIQKKYLDKGLYFLEDLSPDEWPSDPFSVYDGIALNNDARKTIQILKSTGQHDQNEVIMPGLYEEMDKWKWPLHFIDFEAVLSAIPFHKGMSPYEFIPFQFSCHTLYEDGSLQHRADWIEERPGAFPNFEFIRQLKSCLEVDEGTVFRYHNFENTVLNKVAEQLSRSQVPDAAELIEWINTLVTGGNREMVDQFKLIKDYYYSPHMGGSISIKKVLPAVLTESKRLKEIYSLPYSGLYIKDKVFYQLQPENGKAITPYQLLDPIGHGVPDEEKVEQLLQSPDKVIAEGGAAMMAWSRIQFDDVAEQARMAILRSLYEYCELDTLAMVMIQQHWGSMK